MIRHFLPVGTIFEYDGVTAVVTLTDQKKPTCTGCIFSEFNRKKHKLPKISCYAHGYVCTSHTRKDKKQVVFKEVK